MVTAENAAYEKLYYSLWETAQRYKNFTQFRVIGQSHDDRMIPMLEAGEGHACIFCLAGLDGRDRRMPVYLSKMAEEYCQAYELNWILDEDYRVRSLLEQVRICFIPLLNPDGYEIYDQGYSVIRNPIYRQMLKMQNLSLAEFHGNARGEDLYRNFPTNYYTRKRIHQEPASENETKAFVSILQEYESLGLLSFGLSAKKIVYCGQKKSFSYNQKTYRAARHLQKCSGYHLEKDTFRDYPYGINEKSTGSPEQFYAEVIRQPSLRIETPVIEDKVCELSAAELLQSKEYNEVRLLPLEYIYSLEL